jgi:predicted nuclease with RNAse H fold
MTLWLGVDVGGPRKGFDVALIDEERLLDLRRLRRDALVELVEATRPVVVAIDSPCACAPDGARARECELQLNRAVCGIRWTPDARSLRGSDYYAWVREGLALYHALDAETIEVFPTASWTRWFGRRRGTRAEWTTAGLRRLRLRGVPTRTNQDQRDAVAAAVTARQYSEGATERFGEIVVPRERAAPRGPTAARRTRAADPA